MTFLKLFILSLYLYSITQHKSEWEFQASFYFISMQWAWSKVCWRQQTGPHWHYLTLTRSIIHATPNFGPLYDAFLFGQLTSYMGFMFLYTWKKNLEISPHLMYIKGCSWYLKKQSKCPASSIIKGSWFLTDIYAVSQCYLLYPLQKILFRPPVIPPAAVPLDLVKSLSLLRFATYLFFYLLDNQRTGM